MCTICQHSESLKDGDSCFFSNPPRDLALVINNDDQAPDDLSTTNSMDVGDTFFGELDYVGDWDWIEIDLEEGQSVRINLDGEGSNGVADTTLTIYDENGIVVAFNDDAEVGTLNSEVEFTASSSSNYYIVVDSYNQLSDGDYSVEVQEVEIVIPDFDPLDAILWGTELDTSTSNVIDVYFAPDSFVFNDGGLITAETWNSYEIGQVEAAFALIEASIDLEFNIVSTAGAADFTLVMDTDPADFLGFFNPPDTGANSGIGVFYGDNWDRTAGGDLELGGFGFVTIVHELLHGLGLAHLHDNGGFSDTLDGVTSPFGSYGSYNLNQGIYSTMSYNSGLNVGPIGVPGVQSGEFGYEAGPMALDIAALQQLYGANTNYNNTGTTYTLTDANETGTMWQSIWDTGGEDEIVFTGSRDSRIDLQAATLEDEIGGGGFVSGVEGISGGYTIANGVVIENATSGDGDDVVYGNSTANELRSNAGSDEIYGLGGADLIFGGDDGDDLYGGNGRDDIRAGAGNDEAYGGLGNDEIRGQSGGDYLAGNAGADSLSGGNGNDEIVGGNGNDEIVGGNGNDDIFGKNGTDVIGGGSGDDDINGGDGSDDIFGGNGSDNIFGGNGSDDINGGNGSDHINGGNGSDDINGGYGSDDIRGGNGNDILSGGAGSDTFIFDAGSGSDYVTDFDTDQDELLIFDALANSQSAQDLVDSATIVNGNTIISFSDGSTIELDGTFNSDVLVDAINIA